MCTVLSLSTQTDSSQLLTMEEILNLGVSELVSPAFNSHQGVEQQDRGI